MAALIIVALRKSIEDGVPVRGTGPGEDGRHLALTGIRNLDPEAVLELADSFDRLARAAASPAVARRRELAR